MKKRTIILILLLLVAMAVPYIFIPGKLSLSGSAIIATTSNGLDTGLHKVERWMRWWPGSINSDSEFLYKGAKYRLTTPFSDGGMITRSSGSSSFDIRVRTMAQGRDSITAIWQADVETGSDPLTKISRYMNAGKIKNEIQSILDSLYAYAGNTERLYGFPITRTTFTEVILIANQFTTTAPPTNDQVYDVIGKLRTYISAHGATERYYPMMNTRQTDSAHYETMIAISIDNLIPVADGFFISRMVPMKDRFLETNIVGGPSRIRQASEAIQKYMDDHSLSSPARPFEILITDRKNETDSTKWKTNLVYPSM